MEETRRPSRKNRSRRHRIVSFFDAIKQALYHCRCLLGSQPRSRCDSPPVIPVDEQQGKELHMTRSQTSLCSLLENSNLPQTSKEYGRNSGCSGTSVAGYDPTISDPPHQSSSRSRVRHPAAIVPTIVSGPSPDVTFVGRSTIMPLVKTSVVVMESQPPNTRRLVLILTTIAYGRAHGVWESDLAPFHADVSSPSLWQLSTIEASPSLSGPRTGFTLSTPRSVEQVPMCLGYNVESGDFGLVEDKPRDGDGDFGQDKESVACPIEMPPLDFDFSSCTGVEEEEEGVKDDEDEDIKEEEKWVGEEEVVEEVNQPLAEPFDEGLEAESTSTPSLSSSLWVQVSRNSGEKLGSSQENSVWESEPTLQEWSVAFNTALWVWDHFRNPHLDHFRPDSQSHGEQCGAEGMLSSQGDGVVETHHRIQRQVQALSLFPMEQASPLPVRVSQMISVPHTDFEYWTSFYFEGVEAASRLLMQRRVRLGMD